MAPKGLLLELDVLRLVLDDFLFFKLKALVYTFGQMTELMVFSWTKTISGWNWEVMVRRKVRSFRLEL